MVGLRVLSLAENQLTGMLPGSLDLLTRLEAFSVTDQGKFTMKCFVLNVACPCLPAYY